MSHYICPECEKENPFKQKKCSGCGNDFEPPMSFKGLGCLMALWLPLIALVAFPYLPKNVQIDLKKAKRDGKIIYHLIFVPWEDRAVVALKKMPPNIREEWARKALLIAHPTGRFNGISSFDVMKADKKIILRMRVLWYGGFLEKRYFSVFEWQFKREGHLLGYVAEENSYIKTSRNSQTNLDAFFHNRFPGVYNVANYRTKWKKQEDE